MRYIYKFFLWISLAGMISCQEEDTSNQIRIGYVAWEENAAIANVTKLVLEEVGYQVKFRHADIQPIFQFLLPGQKIDVFMDVWMPITHRSYMEKQEGDIEILGTSFEQAKTGLVVPSYVKFNSIEDLNAHRADFGRKITGIDIGAGIMESTEKAIEAYDLEVELIPSTNFAMVSALRTAIENHKTIVVTGWIPHSMFSKFKLKILKDPKNIFGDSEQIQTIARKGFQEDHPKAAEILGRIHFTEREMASLMETLENSQHDYEGAEEWINENRQTVEKWLQAAQNPLKK